MDPFRYKLGGRLFNAEGEEFLHRYGGEDAEKYTTTRDIISYGITKENEAGRATENGGVHLSFQHIPEDDLREAFGPVIDKLARRYDLLGGRSRPRPSPITTWAAFG